MLDWRGEDRTIPALKPSTPRSAGAHGYAHAAGPGIEVESVDVLGENAENATVVVAPYPTDHRGVLATFKVQQTS